MPKPKKHKLIYLEWHDAFAAAGWHTQASVDKFSKNIMIVRQVGWILSENEKYIVMAARHNEETEYQDPQWGNIQKIPKTWIRKRINLTRHIK